MPTRAEEAVVVLGDGTGGEGDSPARAPQEVEASLHALLREARLRGVTDHHLKACPAGRGGLRIARRDDHRVVLAGPALVLVRPPPAVALFLLAPPRPLPLAVDIGITGRRGQQS